MPTDQPDSLWKPRLKAQIFTLASQPFLKSLDYRLFHFDRSADPARPEYNEHCIYVFWHEYISVILPQWGHTPLTVLCSKHRDGEIVSQVALAQGLHIVRGSSNRGGAEALRQMKKHARFSSIGITPDGPRGPRREMAIGPIYLASLLRLPIVPVGVGIDRAWRLRTWDQFAIPKPFSRVRAIMGPKIRLSENLGRPELEKHRESVVRLLNDLTEEAQNWAESGMKVRGEQLRYRGRRANRMIFGNGALPIENRTEAFEPNAISGRLNGASCFSTSMAKIFESACQIRA